ncbi:MAG: hypothetical protein KHY19_08100 [Coprobacillus cateniformis]|nr:hypothetical protein [Coprobacillus cateniformis]
MSKKIMTIDELYSFCLKNNFSKFNSKDFGDELSVEMHGNFEKQKKTDDRLVEGMTPFVSNAFHDHVNLNKSNIEENIFKENVPSSNLRPILANIKLDEETNELDFGSHDFHIEKVTSVDENGNKVEVEKIIYDEQPIGVIDGSRTNIEYDKDAKVNRAVLHGYLYDEYCSDAIDILNRRGTVDCSIELCIRTMSFDGKNKVLNLDDFYVSGLTLLSAKTKPGMAGSNFKIEDFSSCDTKVSFSNEEKLIELLERIDKKLSNFDNKNPKEGGNEKNMFEKLLEKYGKTIEDITFEYEGLSDEELEAKFSAEFEEDTSTSTSSDGEDNSNTSNTNDKYELFNKLFEISFDEIKYALNSLCSIYRNDSEWCYVHTVYEDYFIMQDWDSDKYYKQSYQKDGDNVSLSGERIEMFAMLLTESEKISVEEMRSNYAALKEFKENAEKNELHSQKEELINSEKYSILAEKNEDGEYTNTAFAELVKNMDNYSLTDLETQIKVIHSDYISEHSNFSANKPIENKTVSMKMFTNPNTKKTKSSRYGDLFKK